MGGTRALNRAMNAFCADDDRLVSVASVPWIDPADTLRLTTEALDGGAGLFPFSSDHPHPEGTKDPIRRFEETMDGVSAAGRDSFYQGNCARLLGMS